MRSKEARALRRIQPEWSPQCQIGELCGEGSFRFGVSSAVFFGLIHKGVGMRQFGWVCVREW